MFASDNGKNSPLNSPVFFWLLVQNKSANFAPHKKRIARSLEAKSFQFQ